ncbi:MAG TPA: small multi-drug export protein, partial [Dehalococcoidales bacterium]|nr:small multi-drug export protein [Dehalococcoidales bacterium]
KRSQILLENLLGLDISRELIVLLIAAMPIFELRGALPVAINIFHFPWYYALIIAIVGNILPVPFILLFLNGAVRLLNQVPLFHRWLDWLFMRTKKRSGIIQKYERIGLALFVGIPLPFTGAWTGALAAVILGMSFWRAFISITVGVLIAGIIVTCLSLLGWVGATIAGVTLFVLTVLALWKWRFHEDNLDANSRR